MEKKIKYNKSGFNRLINKLKSKCNARSSLNKKIKRQKYNDEFIILINKAKMDLEQSKNYFSNVSDPDLVDYASHKIMANKSFYTYLIKKAKAENIRLDHFF
ncbi:MAG: DUF2508 family protein [Eubacteriaceae bacterium]